jgi:hypothetical protein
VPRSGCCVQVNETAHKPPSDDATSGINSSHSLTLEASTVNQSFSQQVLSKPSKSDDATTVAHGRGAEVLGLTMEDNPFFNPDSATEGHTAASLAYRYRKV